LFYVTGERDVAERLMDYLRTRLNDMPASSLAWLITTLHTAGVPADHPLIREAATLLEGQQQEDGRWASEDGPERDAHTTVEAVRALTLNTH
jgi:hypothetical protein